MEPVNRPSGEWIARPNAEGAEEQIGASALPDQASEPFEARIVRLDQSAAEEIFRLATR